jgi:hypothetical protein
MEWIIAAIAVFLCLGCFYFGLREGKKLREVRTIERVSDGIKIVSQSEVEMIQPEPQGKPEKTSKGELTPEQQMQNWNEYKG